MIPNEFDAMSPLERMVRLRDAVTGICRAIDAGEIVPRESEMLAIGLVVEQYGGVLAADLLHQLASRCQQGRKALDRLYPVRS